MEDFDNGTDPKKIEKYYKRFLLKIITKTTKVLETSQMPAREVTVDEENKLFENGQFSCQEPLALQRTFWVLGKG